MKNKLPLILVVITVIGFFAPFIFKNKLPIPSDTIVGLYHPYRDFHAKEYPNGIPFKNFLITDPVRQQYPWRNLAVEIGKKFQLPLWNSYSLSGTPLLANFQSAVFYPLNVLFYVLPFSHSWSVLVFISSLLAGLFMYLYLDSLKLNKWASALGSISFALSGFSVVWLEWGTLLQVGMWLPLILFSIDKIFFRARIKNNQKWLWSLVFVFSLVSAFFAGHLQTFFYLFLVSAVYFLAKWIQLGRERKSILIFLFLNSVFLIITSIQWIPTMQFIQLSARNVDQTWQNDGWFIPFQHLIQFVAPDFFGNPTTLNYWGVWNYIELTGYIGILPLIMALLAVSQRRDKKTLFYSVLVIISLIFALPTFIAQIPYILQVPFLSTSQPTRLLFVTDFALVVLAALGFDFFLKHEKRNKVIYSLLVVGLIFISLWLFVFFGYKTFSSISAENIFVAKRNLFLPSVLFAISTILIVGFQKFPKKKYSILIVYGFMILTIFDLFRFFIKFTSFTDQKYIFPNTKSIEFLQKQKGEFRVLTADDRILPPNFSIMYKIQTVDGYDPLYLLRYGEFIKTIERDKPDISPPFGFNRIITTHNFDSRLIDLIGVKYVLSMSDLKSEKLSKVFEEGQTKIYENKNVFPRAFFVEEVLSAKNKNEAIHRMFNSKTDFKTTAIVEEFTEGKKFTKGLVNNIKYRDNEVVIDVKSEDEGFLVLMDTFYPTWHAQICERYKTNCKRTKIYLTNYTFRGVFIPKGEHEIVFKNNLL